MTETKNKRKRTPDYTEAEADVLIKMFVDYNCILNAKHGDTTQAKKKAAYAKIKDAINAVGVCERTLESIKDKWQAIKKKVKAKAAAFCKERKKKASKTGGGEKDWGEEPAFSALEKMVYNIIPQELVEGIDGGFSCDRITAAKSNQTQVTATIVAEVIEDECHQQTPPTAKKAAATKGCRPNLGRKFVHRKSKSAARVTSSSTYYEKMISIEERKLMFQRKMFLLKKEHYARKEEYYSQKLAILRSNEGVHPNVSKGIEAVCISDNSTPSYNQLMPVALDYSVVSNVHE